MLTLKKIAVTGGLSSGKSTVCSLLEELGAYVISADAIVHQLLSPDNAIGQQVIALLGSDIVSDRQLDRNRIAEKVFSHPEKLRALEKIIHPAVFEAIEKKYNAVKTQGNHSLFAAEIPLLYETQTENDYDAVISVIADPDICRIRFLSQGNQETFERRMAQQIDPRKKAAQAQYVIKNNGSLSELKTQVIKIYLSLTK